MRFLPVMFLFSLAMLLNASLASGQKKEFSGPQPGEELSPIKVLRVIGPDKSEEKEILPRSETGDEKGVKLIVFLHKVTEPAMGLMIQLEWYAHQQPDVADHYILLTGDRAKTEQLVKRWWRRPFFAKAPIGISIDGAEGPGRYGLNRNAAMTVLIAKDNHVERNFVYLGPNMTDAGEILTALAAVQKKPAPSVEKIRQELRDARDHRRNARMRENPIFQLASTPQLGRLMVSMLMREDTSAERTKRIADQMRKWAGGDQKKNTELAKYCQAILKGDFEMSETVRKVLQELGSES